MSKLLAFLVLTSSFALAAPPSDSLKSPNMTGTWKTNIDKSTFPGTPPAELTAVMKHDGDKLHMTQITVEPDGNRNSVELEFDTSGKPTVNKVGATELRTTMKVDGDVVREETDFTTPESNFKRKSTISVSPDGKTLTLDAVIIGNAGENKMKIVMEKQ